MSSNFFLDGTPDEVKNAKVIYSISDTHTLLNITTNEQKKDWFLKLNPNGRIPILIDNTKTPPFPVMETSAELLYLLKEFDSKDIFGFKDELERNECLQWLFFWHGSYQGQVTYFAKIASEKNPAWVSGWDFSGAITQEEMNQFPNLLKWIDRIAESGTSEKWQNW
ncbi:predicted protein [Sclerotinia sclerotiorum 1980 UF-70]|uniref:GST N-terminal domain-containing protein n=1 Tax=Sclerotinia sclerotiorum (strain ATCC 18683 / 1980 / Ss-1) TaxID=665079 RepID=A7EVX0_SCLS1|nr:predicted protein [Sclerotinia sclerotiorum 1980 UF-70]EDN93612.1 predicted protein [Sclerotinia sclerotiorum 1980 UF-70]